MYYFVLYDFELVQAQFNAVTLSQFIHKLSSPLLEAMKKFI